MQIDSWFSSVNPPGDLDACLLIGKGIFFGGQFLFIYYFLIILFGCFYFIVQNSLRATNSTFLFLSFFLRRIHCLAKSIRTPIIILQTVRVPSNILTFVGAATGLYI